MELRPLDITVISADDIKNMNTFSKMNVYVEVSISNYPTSTIKKTFVDKNGGENPKWNHSMNFTFNEAFITKPSNFIVFSLKSNRAFCDKEIGKVFVPIHELFNQSNTSGAKEYPVLSKKGKPKGTLKFSYKFGERFTTRVMEAHLKDHVNEHMAAYPAPAYGGYPLFGPIGYPLARAAVASGYGYPTMQQQSNPPGHAFASGYGYPQPAGYGYPPMQQQSKRKNKFGGMGGLGLGLGAGLLGGMLVGDMVSDF